MIGAQTMRLIDLATVLEFRNAGATAGTLIGTLLGRLLRTKVGLWSCGTILVLSMLAGVISIFEADKPEDTNSKPTLTETSLILSDGDKALWDAKQGEINARLDEIRTEVKALQDEEYSLMYNQACLENRVRNQKVSVADALASDACNR